MTCLNKLISKMECKSIKYFCNDKQMSLFIFFQENRKVNLNTKAVNIWTPIDQSPHYYKLIHLSTYENNKLLLT